MKKLHLQEEVCVTHGEHLIPETFDAEDMMGILKCSRPTLGKRTEESRVGLIDMPPPFTKKGQRPVWCAQAIRDWVTRRQTLDEPASNVQSAQHTDLRDENWSLRQLHAAAVLQEHRNNRDAKKRGRDGRNEKQ